MIEHSEPMPEMDDENDIYELTEEHAPDLPADEARAFDLANWHVRAVDRIRRERLEFIELIQAEMRRLQMRLDARVETFDKAEEWHARPLRNLHAAVLERDGKRKTIHLASGDLKAREQQAEWDYIDVDAFGAWAMENRPELIVFPEPKPQIDRNAAKQALVKRDEKGKPLVLGVDPETNEIPPGLVVNERDRKYEVVIDGDD